jgi:hypothetical protein
MAHRYNSSNHPFVVIADGFMQLYTHTGEEVVCNEWIRLTDSAHDISTAVCKFVVNIVGSKEEMMQEIEKYKTNQQ